MYNPILINDFYKLCHMLQFKPEITSLTSYLTPRASRLKSEGINEVVFFGLSGYIQKYIEEEFENHFFARSFDLIRREVHEVLHHGLNYSNDMIDKTLAHLLKLHCLGYLPVEINAVPEGTLVPMGVPCVEIRTTDPNLAWVGQALEASLSAAIWQPMISATVGLEYRKIVEKAFAQTVNDTISARTGMCDFSMRGQESNESAIASSAGWLTAMWNSSTVAARDYIQTVYLDQPEDLFICGLTSTEHAVMTTHACIDGGDETNTYAYLFDLYKNESFAAVCDSYDFWNVLTNILPKFKSTIIERGQRGKFIGVRHDSAEPVEALCGIPVFKWEEYLSGAGWMSPELYGNCCFIDAQGNERIHYLDKESNSYRTEERKRTWEEKGMVETMYELFGGDINRKGYKVLIPGIKAVYGDSITIPRAKEIYRRLAAKGFAANNVSLGVGSFSFQCMEAKDGHLLPFTRDTFSIAIKCTYATYKDKEGKEHEMMVFKDPAGFSGKKSQKGLCNVFFDEHGKLTYTDEHLKNTYRDYRFDNSAMVNYFLDGEVRRRSFNDIRERITNAVRYAKNA